MKHWLKAPREIRPRLRKGSQYLTVPLLINNRNLSVRVHRLVWLAFHGEISPDKEMNHLDGNKLNNRLDNLEEVTCQENSIHAHRMGLTNPAKGSKINTSKLNAREVLEIRAKLAEGSTLRELGEMHGISYHSVWAIKQRKTWSHI